MKRILLLLFIITLFSCKRDNVYFYTRIDRSEAKGLFEKEDIKIKAPDDSTAFDNAFQMLKESRKIVYSFIKQGRDISIYPYPMAFTLESKDGRSIFYRSIIDRYDSIWVANSPMPSDGKAFAGTDFGMSVKDVLAIDGFDQFKYDNDHYLEGDRKVGKYNYKVGMTFKNDELYRVSLFTHPSGNSDLQYIRNRIENLRDLFLTAYGEPSYYYGLPTENENDREIKAWERYSLFEWKSSAKSAIIRYYCDREGKYGMEAIITDKQREKQIKDEQNKEVERYRKEQKEIEAAEKEAAAAMF